VNPDVARAGGAVGAVGLALLLLATRRELRIAGLVAWAAGCAILATYLAPHGHHRLFAAAAVVGLVVAAGGAWLSLRVPWLLACATLACVPARIPVHVGSTQANLLLPIYGVVVVAAFALAWELYGEEPRTRELGPLVWPVAAFVAWDGLSLLWSQDVKQGAIELLFFVLPFGLLTLALARLPWSRSWVVGLFAQLAAMALIFAAIGIVQYEERDIFWNPKVIVDNAYAPSGWFYRVNSVFYDPSIYGRFLVVGIVVGLVVVLRRTDPLWMIALALAIGITWAGLLPSFSQSSFTALFAAVCVLLVVVWHRRAVVFVGVAIVVAALVAGLGSPQIRHRLEGKSSTSFSHITSGRSKLVTNGLKIVEHHPVLGVGVGGFKHAYGQVSGLRGKEPKAAASHTTPITVSAETGLPGLALLLWLVGTALAVGFRRLGPGFAGTSRLAFAVALTAILVHCLFYNALFEDPTTWGLLALVALGARVEGPVVRARA
jgi:O-Antigen ligase